MIFTIAFMKMFENDVDYDSSRVKRLTVNGKTFSNKLTATPLNLAVRSYNSVRTVNTLALIKFESIAEALEQHKKQLPIEYGKAKRLLQFMQKAKHILSNGNEL